MSGKGLNWNYRQKRVRASIGGLFIIAGAVIIVWIVINAKTRYLLELEPPARYNHPYAGRVDERGVQGELRRVLTDAIDALPPDYRTALVLHDVEGLSSPDISQALGIGLAAVKLRVHRSRLFVRKHLSEHLEPA